MKIYCDENVEAAIIKGLRRRNIEVISVRELGNFGKSDEFHLELAKNKNAVILTHDSDFLKLAHSWNIEKKEHKGIIFAHPQHISIGGCVRKIELLTTFISIEDMKNHIEFL